MSRVLEGLLDTTPEWYPFYKRSQASVETLYTYAASVPAVASSGVSPAAASAAAGDAHHVAVLDNSHIITSLCSSSENSSMVAKEHSVFVDSPEAANLFALLESDAKYNGRTKHYSDTFSKTTVFSKPVFNPLKIEPREDEKQKNRAKRRKADECEEAREDSLYRAREKVREIAYANKFTHFVTLTLDESKISRTDAKEIVKALNRWFSNMVQRHDMIYEVVPEEHKRIEADGKHAIHFHGLIAGNLRLADSGKKTKNGQAIFNLENWKYGFSTAIELYGERDKAINYVLKYISKDNKQLFGRWYFSGGDIKREVPTEYFNTDYDDFDAEYEKEVVPAAVDIDTVTGVAFEVPYTGLKVKCTSSRSRKYAEVNTIGVRGYGAMRVGAAMVGELQSGGYSANKLPPA